MGLDPSYVLELIEASLDRVAQALGSEVDADMLLAGLAHSDDRHNVVLQ